MYAKHGLLLELLLMFTANLLCVGLYLIPK